jgi:hypothetical protein
MHAVKQSDKNNHPRSQLLPEPSFLSDSHALQMQSYSREPQLKMHRQTAGLLVTVPDVCRGYNANEFKQCNEFH